jgi:hypothetical protein
MDADAGIGQSRPDRFGEPRPPAAPRSGASYRHPVRVLHLDPHDPARRWRRIGPPERPPLEAVLVSGRARLVGAVWESSVVAVCALALAGWGVWSGRMWLGLAVGLGAAVALTVLWRFLVADVGPPVAAGADWVGGPSVWLPLYELTRIDAAPARNTAGDDLPGTVALTLWQGTRGIMRDMALLQSNPALWDLVYQGLLASIAAGAELSEDARQALRQP